MKLPIKIKSLKYYQFLVTIKLLKLRFLFYRNKYSPYIISIFSVLAFFYSFYKFLIFVDHNNWINLDNSWITINSSLLQSNTALIAIYLVVATIFLPYLNHERNQLHNHINKLKAKEKSRILEKNLNKEVSIDMIEIWEEFDKCIDKLMEKEPNYIYKNLKISSITILTIIILSIIGMIVKFSISYSIYYLSFILSLQMVVIIDIYNILSVYFERFLFVKSENDD